MRIPAYVTISAYMRIFFREEKRTPEKGHNLPMAIPWVCMKGCTQVQSLGWEDPLEEEMATHSSILAWKIPWTKRQN